MVESIPGYSKAEWRSRIIGHGRESPEQLLANPSNWRTHPREQQAALEGVLDEVGWIQGVIVNQRTGHLIDGHLRVTLAMRHDEAEIDVDYVDLSQEEEDLVLATLDELAGMATTDGDKLAELCARVKANSPAVEDVIARLRVKAQAAIEMARAGNETPDPGAQVDRAGELQEKWGVVRGQIWEVGRHRVMCGDSTSAEDVGRLYSNAILSMIWTDPPYGVSYGEKNRYLQSIGPANRLLGDIEGDQASPSEVYALVKDALLRLVVVSKPGAVAYVASPPGTLLPWFIRAMNDSKFEYHHQLIWLKNQLVFGRCDYMYKHESVLYGWLQNGAHHFIPVTNNCSVFEFDRPRASKLHPTEKPDELVAAMIRNSSLGGEIVGEPFAGSGTTLVACEQTGRIGYGMEICEKYVSVTLERLTGLGLEARLVDG